jgi:putative membrane protein
MRTLHPFTAVRDALAYGLQFGTFGFVAGTMAGAVDLPIAATLLLGPLGLVLGVGFGVARYLVFEYELGETALHITSGVVQRQQREIPLRRIQNVDVEQSPLQRLLGLAVVRFETAGGGQTEAVLRMVGKDEADRLQRTLRERKRERAAAGADDRPDAAADETPPTAATGGETPTPGSPGEGPDRPPGGPDRDGEAAAASVEQLDAVDGAIPEGVAPTDEGTAAGVADEEEVLFELSLRDLLVRSALTVRWSVVTFVAFALPVVGDRIVRLLQRLLVDAVDGGVDPGTVGRALAAAVALVALAWLAGAAVTFVRYYGFRLSRIDDELVYERGLLQRYSGSIPLDKVQTLTVTENPLMRWFGYAALTVETAGYAAGSSDDGGVPSAVPLADREAVAEFVADLEGVADLSVERPPKRARRRFAGRYALAILGATALLVAVDRTLVSLHPLWALPLAALPVAPVAAHLKWRNLGHRAADDHFLARMGFWRRTTRVAPYYRIQTVVTERTLFQRRWNLASVVADTAASGSLLGRAATAHDVDAETAAKLHQLLRRRLREQLAARE